MSRSNRRPARRIPGFVRPAKDQEEIRRRKASPVAKVFSVTDQVFNMLRDRDCTDEIYNTWWKVLSLELRYQIITARNARKKETRLIQMAEALARLAAEKEEKRSKRLKLKARQEEERKARKEMLRQAKKMKGSQRKEADAARDTEIRKAEADLIKRAREVKQRSTDPAKLIPLRIDSRTVVMMRPDRDPAKVIRRYSNLRNHI